MKKIKVTIIYYSSTGTNYQLAGWAKEAAETLGAKVRLRKVKELASEDTISTNPAWEQHVEHTKHIEEASLDDLEWANAIIFSAPTRFGNLPAQMKQFLDATGPLWQQGKLANKAVTAMTSAMNDHGGQEATILALYTSMYHWGAIVVAPGYTDKVLYQAGGNPYGTSVSVDKDGNMQQDVKNAVVYQAKRCIEIATKLA